MKNSNKHQNSAKLLSEWAKSFPFLSEKEEKKLIKLAQAGSSEAIDVLIKSNFRYAIAVAFKCNSDPFWVDDSIGESLFGFLKSISRFEEGKGVGLRTYATWWVRQCIHKLIDDNTGALRIPANRIVFLRQINKMIDREYVRTGKELSLEAIIDVVNNGKKDKNGKVKEYLRETMCLGQNSLSLESPINHGENANSTLVDIIVDESCEGSDRLSINKEIYQFIKDKCFSLLDEREEKVILAHFGFIEKNGKLVDAKSMSLEQLGDGLCLTRERVRQIEAKALKKIKKRFKSSRQLLAQFL